MSVLLGLRRAPRLAAPRLSRGRAEEAAAATGTTLNVTVPASAIYENVPAEMVLVPSVDGVFGILHNHVPTIAELKPGVVSITETEGATPKEYFVSGGFASSAPRTSRPPPPSCRLTLRRAPAVDANSVLNISALEAVPVEDLDAEAVKVGLRRPPAAASARTTSRRRRPRLASRCGAWLRDHQGVSVSARGLAPLIVGLIFLAKL